MRGEETSEHPLSCEGSEKGKSQKYEERHRAPQWSESLSMA